jgi:hypothetical protein
MLKSVLEIEPYFRGREGAVRRIVSVIFEAASEHGINPWIALSMAYRESSLLPSVGSGRRRGALGEVGYFQIMPGGYAIHVCGSGRSMTSARANADTAMCYLAHIREVCESDDPSVYVAAYGMRNCPTDATTAMRLPRARRARSILCQMAGEERCNVIWPMPS